MLQEDQHAPINDSGDADANADAAGTPHSDAITSDASSQLLQGYQQAATAEAPASPLQQCEAADASTTQRHHTQQPNGHSHSSKQARLA